VSQPPGHERHGERQRGHQVARREPEAEHRRRQERGHQQLGAHHRGAEAGRQLDLAHARHGAREPIAPRAPQPPQPGEREREDGRPAQQPVRAVHEQRHQSVGALQVAARKGRAGRAFPGRVGGVWRGPAVDRLVDRHEQPDREQRQLDRPHCEGSAPRAPDRPRREHADHDARHRELGSQPRQSAEEQEAQRRVPPRHPRVQSHRQQRGSRQHRRRAELGVHGRAVGQERRAEPDRQRRAERPGIRRHAQREPVGERHREGGDRREEELHRLRPAERVGRRDQQREAHPVRLVQAPVRLPPVRSQLVRVERRVGAVRVLVEQVDVAVVRDRLGGEQVVRLVAAVVRARERVEPQRRGVDAEQQQPEGEGATHPAPHPSHEPLVGYGDLLLIDRHRPCEAFADERADDPEVVHDERSLRHDAHEVLGAAHGIHLLLAAA
jgi:hypothetical protein